MAATRVKSRKRTQTTTHNNTATNNTHSTQSVNKLSTFVVCFIFCFLQPLELPHRLRLRFQTFAKSFYSVAIPTSFLHYVPQHPLPPSALFSCVWRVICSVISWFLFFSLLSHSLCLSLSLFPSRTFSLSQNAFIF